MPIISIIILNWNSGKYLEYCCQALRDQSFRDFEVICIDNGSSDISLTWLKKTNLKDFIGSETTLIYNNENVGFAEGMNQGIRKSKGKLIIPLNVDVFLENNFLENIVQISENFPNISVFGANIFKYDPKLNSKTDEQLCTAVFPNKHMSLFTKLPFNFDEKIVFGPAGCCPIYRKEMLDAVAIPKEISGEQLQYFDSNYFAYGEDVDLYWRMNILGYQALYCEKLRAWHVHSGTQSGVRWWQKNSKTIFRITANAYATWLKNMYGKSFWIVGFYMLFMPYLMFFTLLLKAPKKCLAPILAYYRMISYLPYNIKLRYFFMSHKKISEQQQLLILNNKYFIC